MLKTKAPSVAGWFRKLFKENPELLQGTSNADVLQRWRADHPGQHLNDKIKGSMANTKSIMRQQLGIAGHRRKRRKHVVAAAANKLPRVPAGVLQTLELKIDAVLAVARQHEYAGLTAVAKHLRFARNGVVMKQA